VEGGDWRGRGGTTVGPMFKGKLKEKKKVDETAVQKRKKRKTVLVILKKGVKFKVGSKG